MKMFQGASSQIYRFSFCISISVIEKIFFNILNANIIIFKAFYSVLHL